MLELGQLRRFLALEQQQPAIEVVGQHRQLKMNAVGGPAPGRIGRQTRIVVGFLDQILGPSALQQVPSRRLELPHRPVSKSVNPSVTEPLQTLCYRSNIKWKWVYETSRDWLGSC